MNKKMRRFLQYSIVTLFCICISIIGLSVKTEAGIALREEIKEYRYNYVVGESFTISGVPFSANLLGGEWLSGPTLSFQPENSYNSIFSNLRYSITDTSSFPKVYPREHVSFLISISGKAEKPGVLTINTKSTYVCSAQWGGTINNPRVILTAIGSGYQVQLNPNGGKCSATSHDVVYNQPYSYKGNLPEPTREGYVFEGWYTAASGGTKITGSTNFVNKAAMFSTFETSHLSPCFSLTA